MEPRVAQVGDGAFLFRGVPPGDYVVHTVGAIEFHDVAAGLSVIAGLQGLAQAPREFGMAFTTVTGDEVDSVFIQTTVGTSISGRVLVKDSPTELPPPGVRLVAVPADPDLAPAQIRRTALVDANAGFVMTSLFGPLRFALQDPPPGWGLDAVQIGSVNAADDPVTFGGPETSPINATVVLRQGGAEISGHVTGAGRAGALVVVFAADRRHWHALSRYFEVTTSDDEGRFVVRGLPAGDYLVAALESESLNLNTDEWQDPNVLAGLVPFAGRVSVGEDGRGSADVRALR